jgi:hypothetical protein
LFTHYLAEALSNQPISDIVTFKDGIAQYRLGKVVSAWRIRMLFQNGAIRYTVEVLI